MGLTMSNQFYKLSHDVTKIRLLQNVFHSIGFTTMTGLPRSASNHVKKSLIQNAGGQGSVFTFPGN